MAEHVPCGNACCRSGKPGILEVFGHMEVPEEGKYVRKPVCLKLCEDCAKPILAAHKKEVSCGCTAEVA